MKKQQLIKIAKGFTEGILNGEPNTDYCYLVCMPLQGYLSWAENIETELTEGWLKNDKVEAHHYWLTLSNGDIIDPTASQFNYFNCFEKMPDIYIGEKPIWYFKTSHC